MVGEGIHYIVSNSMHRCSTPPVRCLKESHSVQYCIHLTTMSPKIVLHAACLGCVAILLLTATTASAESAADNAIDTAEEVEAHIRSAVTGFWGSGNTCYDVPHTIGNVLGLPVKIVGFLLWFVSWPLIWVGALIGMAIGFITGTLWWLLSLPFVALKWLLVKVFGLFFHLLAVLWQPIAVLLAKIIALIGNMAFTAIAVLFAAILITVFSRMGAPGYIFLAITGLIWATVSSMGAIILPLLLCLPNALGGLAQGALADSAVYFRCMTYFETSCAGGFF